MGNKLTKIEKNPQETSALTDKSKTFYVLLGNELNSEYSFYKIESGHSKALFSFFSKTVGKVQQYVDSTFKRPTDKNDRHNNKQVEHYRVNDKFRIHGYYNDKGYFVLLKIDPSHKVHNKKK